MRAVALLTMALILVAGCHEDVVSPPSPPAPIFAPTGTITKTGPNTWRVFIVPHLNVDTRAFWHTIAVPSGCAALQYRYGDVKTDTTCVVEFNCSPAQGQSFELTLFIQQSYANKAGAYVGDVVASGVLAAIVPTQVNAWVPFTILMADQKVSVGQP